jgi:hypothetical protein
MDADVRTVGTKWSVVGTTGQSLIRVYLAVDFVTHNAFFCVTRKYESVVTIANEAVLCSVTYTKSRHGCKQIGSGRWCLLSVSDLLPAFDFFM